MSLDTPVAFFIFNRPLQTARVFAQIALAKPRTLLIVADGARNDSERPACDAARAVVRSIDWDCDVRLNYSDKNLGCRRRMSGGIDWVFGQCERAILLEDDCLPHPTFFPYCRELLERYADDERVMMVSGDNFQFGRRCTGDSYYFSAIPHIWGWASWRRAWAHYDVDMKRWPEAAATDFPGALVPSYAARSHRRMMADTFAGKIDTWDVQFTFAAWLRNSLSVLPAVNLVSNIGFGPGATHTKKPDAFAALPAEPMEFPLRHPADVRLCAEADESFFLQAIKAA